MSYPYAQSLADAEDMLVSFLYHASPRQNRIARYEVGCSVWPPQDFQDDYDSTFFGYWDHKYAPEIFEDSEDDRDFKVIEFVVDFNFVRDDDD